MGVSPVSKVGVGGGAYGRLAMASELIFVALTRELLENQLYFQLFMLEKKKRQMKHIR